MAEALIWLHGFGGGVFVGALMGLWLGLANRKPEAPDDGFFPGEALRHPGVVCGRCGCSDLMAESHAVLPDGANNG